MPEGIYAAAAGMAAQQARLDSLANDVANVNTTAYKQQRLGFRDLVYSAEQGIPTGAGAAVVDAGRSSAQGTLLDTGDPLTVALVGRGYLQVQRGDGSTALTRDGRLSLDAAGSIVTATGNQLVPPIKVPAGTDPASISIGPDGAITVAGTSIGTLSIADVPAPDALTPVGDNLFVANAASGAPTAITDTTVQQGYLESSSVDLATAMTSMIDAQRGYELASRAIKTQDQLLDIANQLVR
jgi:flagellar basal-body rod protein FlgG